MRTFPPSYAYSGGFLLRSFSDPRRSDQVIEEAVIFEGDKKNSIKTKCGSRKSNVVKEDTILLE